MISSAIAFATLLVQQQAGPATRAATGPVPSAEAVAADTGALRHANGRVPPVAFSVRATAGAPRVDGRLDDPVWAQARPVSRFTQQSPDDGQAATESTEVRLAYDDEAVYVAARMYDSDPDRITARLGRRDGSTQSDAFEVDFDSYHDHRTTFAFMVNPLGVKTDAVYSNDNSYGDTSWDPVWDVATRRDSIGWTAEFRVPLSQLRFPNSAAQVWGVNFVRYVHRKQEYSLWAYVAQTDQGFPSFFGHAFGIANLPQPRRLEVLPYAAGAEERLRSGSAENPFNDGSRERVRGGLDLKYGVTSNLTLNATVNPDFGQVEADPAVVNLTAYETYFEERRPFFVEGADIFGVTSGGFIQSGGAQYLYSRRIGREPQGYADYRGEISFTDQPANTTILGAAKLSGRTAGGWSIGLLDAVTAREYATTDSAGTRFRDEVEPLTNYGVLRAKRDFGRGASTLGFIGTAVNRRLDVPRLSSLRSAAYAGGVDFTHRFSQNRYSLFAAFGYSHIRGDTAAIQAAQASSARYYQRPDADHVSYDPTRTSLVGWNAALGISKDQGGTNFSLSVDATSPGFEINDLGFQTSADRVNLYVWSGHRWTRPGKVFRFASLTASGSGQWNFGGTRLATRFSSYAYGQFLNFWSVQVGGSVGLRALSDDLTRGGPLAVGTSSWNASLYVSSDYRKPWQAGLSSSYSRNELGGWGVALGSSFSLRPTPTVQVSLGPEYYASLTKQQYLTSRPDTTAAAMYGRRHLFAEVLQRSLDLTARLNVTLSRTLSLQLYAQPFVATGDYRRFKELQAPRTLDYIFYGETPGSTLDPVVDTADDGAVSIVGYQLDPDGAGTRPAASVDNRDFSYRSLRGNAVLRWEYRPGSTLFLVWTTSCENYGANPRFNAVDDFRQLCQGRSDNVFAVKFNYWLSL